MKTNLKRVREIYWEIKQNTTQHQELKWERLGRYLQQGCGFCAKYVDECECDQGAIERLNRPWMYDGSM